MQFTLLASLAVLCSAAFAAPARRDDSSLIGVDVSTCPTSWCRNMNWLACIVVDNVLNNLDVNVLTRDVLAAPPARRDDDDLIGVDVSTYPTSWCRNVNWLACIVVDDVLNDADITILKRYDESLIGVLVGMASPSAHSSSLNVFQTSRTIWMILMLTFSPSGMSFLRMNSSKVWRLLPLTICRWIFSRCYCGIERWRG